MILDIDAGNTAVKWRLTDLAGAVHARGRVDANDQQGWFPGDLGRAITAIRVSNVAGLERRQQLIDQLQAVTAIEPRFAEVEQAVAGLQLCYPQVERLGVDRWLAMLAARSKTVNPFLVVDCGSAITADQVDARGHQLGGYIVPGYSLLHAALFKGTSEVKVAQSESMSCSWGGDTEEAVNHGVSRMVQCFCQSLVDEVAGQAGLLSVFITGGDASKVQLQPADGVEYRFEPDLVLDGLACALPMGVS